jgi:hypothetical protein
MRESAMKKQGIRVRSTTFPSRLGSPVPELRVFIVRLSSLSPPGVSRLARQFMFDL